MANKSLTDLTARTATADSDLIHVNNGGTDYKETKQNFLRGNLAHQFANDSTLTSQLDTLASAIGFGTVHGDISSNGHQTETGMPVNSNGTVFARIYSTAQMSVSFSPNATSDEYVIFKQGTWGTWEKRPTRAEMDRIRSDLATIIAGSSKTFTVANNSRLLLVSTGGADSRCGIWNIFVTSTGVVVVSPVGTPGTYISVSSSGNNTIVVSNTTSGSGSAYINAVVFAGSIT